MTAMPLGPSGPPPMPIYQRGLAVWEHPAVIALLMVFCCPVGLVLVWISPRTLGKKLAWTAGYIGMLALVIGTSDPPAETAIRKADKLWDDNQRLEAIKEYKYFLTKRKSWDDSESSFAVSDPIVRGRWYRRIIEHEAAYGDPAEARDWARAAVHEKIFDLNFESPRAREIWDDAGGWQ